MLFFLADEIKANRKLLAIVFAELFFTFVLVSFFSGFLMDMSVTMNVIKGMNDDENWYYLCNNSYNASHDGDYMTEEWDEFYSYIMDNCMYCMGTSELKNLSGDFIWSSGKSVPAIGIGYVSDNYFEVIENASETAERLISYEGEYTPIALGENFKRYYNIGDVIDGAFQVVGFLPPNSVINISGNYKLTDNKDSVTTLMRYWENQSLDRAATDVCVYAEDETSLLLLLEKAKELGISSVAFVSFSERAEFMMKQFLIKFTPYFLIALGLTAFTAVGLSVSLRKYFYSKLNEYLINQICGATVSSIVLRFVIIMALEILLAAIPVIFLFRSAGLFLLSVALGVVVVMFSLARPVAGIMKKPLIAQYYESKV